MPLPLAAVLAAPAPPMVLPFWTSSVPPALTMPPPAPVAELALTVLASTVSVPVLWMPPPLLGASLSLTMLAWGFQGALSLPFGMLADAVGEREMLAGIGVLLGVIAAVGGLLALRLAKRGAIRRPHEIAAASLERHGEAS